MARKTATKSAPTAKKKAKPSAEKKKAGRASPRRKAVAARPVELEHIQVRGAAEHNLKRVDVDIPKKALVVFTGPSGSGKSSLAFDTIYAEGQRRFVESLSAYARQFLGQLDKPHYDHIRGLSPTIAIEQKAASSNPRSTVGTITEVADYLRVLFARAGVQHCPGCDRPVERQSAQEMVSLLLREPPRTRMVLLAPRVVARKGEHKDIIDGLRKEGLVRARVDGEVVALDRAPALDKKKKHTIEAVVDRIVTPEAGAAKARDDTLARLTDSVETAMRLGDGVLVAHFPDRDEDRVLSERLACGSCERSFPDLSPQSFSFNSPLGMCQPCNGLGETLEFDEASLVNDPDLSLAEGALKTTMSSDKAGKKNGQGDDEGAGRRGSRQKEKAKARSKKGDDDGDFEEAASGSWQWRIIEAVCREFSIDPNTPWRKLPKKHQRIIFDGTGDREVEARWKGGKGSGTWRTRFEGLLPQIKRRYLQTQSEAMKEHYRRFMSPRRCGDCGGARLREESRHVRVGGQTLPEVSAFTIAAARSWIVEVGDRLGVEARAVAAELVKEIRSRLGFLENVGLEYLTLDRSGPTLSGGEAQRIRLASQIGSELSGVIYVLDEPSIGLHPRDNRRLLDTLCHLRDLGNSVIVVEHDREAIESADWLVDFGPGAGLTGGEVVAAGRPAEVTAGPGLTGRYLRGDLEIAIPARRRTPTSRKLVVNGARENNLDGVDVAFPTGVLCGVSGVSGAGKSSLVNRILFPALARRLMGAHASPGEHDAITGMDHVDKVIDIDQRPIGRTPRSNPATYVKLFDLIRQFFAALPEARVYGFLPGRFSFNVKGGRCEACAGDGVKKIEMHFLADVYVTCEECDGKRFNDATLRVRYQGKSIADILDLTVAEAADLFRNHPHIARILATLVDVGLDYVKLGQSSTTLSGGEAQRVKLSRELSRVATGRTVYILDEPSTGLHFDDVKKLLAVLDRLVEAGNTVIVIEHNLDVLKCCDWLIDLGPEGGAGGGRVIATGTPEDVAKCKESHTGRFLKPLLKRRRAAGAKATVTKVTKTGKTGKR